MTQTLTIDQMKTMSIDEIIAAYQSGYRIPENVETNLEKSLSYSNISNPEIVGLQHYTASDVGVIAAAIGISVSIMGLLAYYYIKKEEKRILKDVRESVLGSFGKYGPSALEKIAERLAPAAERFAERILPEKRYRTE